MLAVRRGVARRIVGTGAWAVVAWLVACAVVVRADDGVTYEQSALERVLAGAKLEVDPSPTGKTIAYVRYERHEVFDGEDLLLPVVLPRFAPSWPNAFHGLTQRSTIEREVLLREGESFDPARAEESVRNLRALGIFALVRVVAVKTRDPVRVGVLVYTRDLWSLRLESSFAGAGATFTLGAALVERNFLGRNKEVSVRVFVDPLTYRVGETYLDPRMFGGKLRLYEAFDVIVRRATGKVEGSTGSLLWGMPFHDLAQTRAFDVLAQYADYVYRDAPDGEVTGFDAGAGDGHRDACVPGAADCIARVWDDRSVRLESAVHERVGERYKQTFTLGAGVSDRSVAANSETALAPTLREVFARDVLPRVRREVFPFVRYRLSLPRFATFTNLGTFGQSETVQRGPRLDARFALPLDEFGSSTDGFVARGRIGYVWAGADAIFDVAGQAHSRVEEQEVIDKNVRLRLRAASPSYRWLLGRLVLRGIWDARSRDTQNTLVALGGDSGLRGFSSQRFYGFGVSSWLGNIEYRTKPWAMRSVHLGLVAFYDAGAVYRDLSAARAHHAVGLGLRGLFPQFNRYAFRVDCGVPLDTDGFALTVSYGSSQAVALTAGEDALAEDPFAGD